MYLKLFTGVKAIIFSIIYWRTLIFSEEPVHHDVFTMSPNYCIARLWVSHENATIRWHGEYIMMYRFCNEYQCLSKNNWEYDRLDSGKDIQVHYQEPTFSKTSDLWIWNIHIVRVYVDGWTLSLHSIYYFLPFPLKIFISTNDLFPKQSGILLILQNHSFSSFYNLQIL